MRKGQTAPRRRTSGLRARAWWVMRKNKAMTLAELQTTLCDGTEKDPKAGLRKWLNHLVKAGVMSYERVDDGKLTSNGSYRYTLVKDLGPQAPIYRTVYQRFFDPNSGLFIDPNPPQPPFDKGGSLEAPEHFDKGGSLETLGHFDKGGRLETIPPLEKGGKGGFA